MTTVDVLQIEGDCDIIKDYIEKCRRNHKKISPRFIFEKGKSIMDYAYQCYCLSKGEIPICGIYKFN